MGVRTTQILLVHEPRAEAPLVDALACEHYELFHATSGDEAIARSLSEEFAVIVLDQPEAQGIATAREIAQSQHGRRTPIVFLSSNAERANVLSLYDAGVADVVLRPVDPALLRAKVAVFAELHRSAAAIIEDARELEGYVSVLGHDLRNPLSAIDLGAAILRQRPANDPAVTRLLDRIQGSARRMSLMIDQVAELPRCLRPGEMVLSREDADLAPAIQTVVDRTRAAHPDRQITLECPGAISGSWDVPRLGQALWVLVGNALAHGAPGRPVTVNVKKDGAKVVIAVHNEGPPITDAARASLFTPAHELEHHHKTPRTEALGLGLFITHAVVTAHGGSIDVRSGAETGTTFEVTLPMTAGYHGDRTM